MGIQIASKKEGFRRCGMAHSSTPTTYADGHFTKAQLRELEAEPMLIVVRVPDPKPDAKSDGKNKGKDEQ